VIERASVEAIRAHWEEHQVNKVKLGGFDLDGVLRGKYVSIEKFWSALADGFGFCDVIFGWDCGDMLYELAPGSQPPAPGEGHDPLSPRTAHRAPRTAFTGWHTGFPDLVARIDPATCRLVPWEERTGFALCEFFRKEDGAPLPICPRQTLRRVIDRIDRLGLEPRAAAEYEFFLFEETPQSLQEKDFRGLKAESPGMFCYSLLRAGARAGFVQTAMEQLSGFGIPLEGLHTETGPGAFEAAIRYDTALAAADGAGLFKAAVKELAGRCGLVASFMAKWSASMPGCGGHLHQSLWDGDGRNQFADAGRPERISRLARQYVAGQQRYLPEWLPLLCPTINSYKRLVPGYWAPTTATWGLENRTTAIRVIPGTSSKAARVETRIVGADANPYLALAACLGAGLLGIEQRLEPSEPTVGNAYERPAGADPRGCLPAPALPRSLAEATARFRMSDEARALFGDAFVDHLCMTRDWECREFEKAVTDWELRRYFEII
jgi:glutamine synthetase